MKTLAKIAPTMIAIISVTNATPTVAAQVAAVRSDCIDEQGPEDKPDGICDDCVGGSFAGGGSYGDGEDDGECEDVDGDNICDDCDAMINGETIRDDCLDANSNGTCDDCEADKCPDYDEDETCDACDADCGGPGCIVRPDCIDEDGDKICDDCQLNCFETLSNSLHIIRYLDRTRPRMRRHSF